MAATGGAIWAVEIGNNSLKALHLSAESGAVEVIGFADIRHGRILTGEGVTDVEREELIALTLRRFVTENDLGKDEVIVSVPSQNSFARFVNLPPVEQKRIPEIVRFEAVQQIPFDINDVQWDWQLMEETAGAERKVGIFAIKNEVVGSVLEHFSRENVAVGYVQMAPMALYNYALHDLGDSIKTDEDAIVILDIGAENTDLVVCTKSAVWQRCILLGGNAFTRAIGDTFKLSFQKAEKLKRTAPMSKYARQIFQAMRPIFVDLASEVQRSLGFYNSSNPNTKVVKIVALGGGARLRGLLKYIQQSLRMPVERPDSFKRLSISSGVSAVKFHEHVCDYGIVYGLGVQALGFGRIESNLLPRGIARSMAWAGKAKYFTAAACLLLLVSVLSFARTLIDRASYGNRSDVRGQIDSIYMLANEAKTKLEAQKSKGSDYAAMVEAEFEPFLYREVVPKLTHSIFAALPNGINNPEQKSLYEAFSRGDVEAVLATERKDRRQIFVTGMAIRYMRDVNTPNFEGTDVKLMSQAGIGSGDYSRYYTEAREKSYRASYADPTGIGAALPKTTGGFAVTIAGYSPYKNLSALLAEAGPDRRRWGVVTRLAHLDEMGIFPPDVNCPFELYKVGEDGHFKLDKGPVETGFEGRSEVGTMPPGIGLLVNRFERGKIPIDSERDEMIEKMLIDPMTKETISKVVELDQYGRKKTDRFGNVIETVNDNWFLLSLKFAWKEAPDPPAMPAPPPSVYEQEEDTWGTGRSGDSWESPSSTGTGSSGTTTDDFEL